MKIYVFESIGIRTVAKRFCSFQPRIELGHRTLQSLPPHQTQIVKPHAVGHAVRRARPPASSLSKTTLGQSDARPIDLRERPAGMNKATRRQAALGSWPAAMARKRSGRSELRREKDSAGGQLAVAVAVAGVRTSVRTGPGVARAAGFTSRKDATSRTRTRPTAPHGRELAGSGWRRKCSACA